MGLMVKTSLIIQDRALKGISLLSFTELCKWVANLSAVRQDFDIFGYSIGERVK